MWIIICSTLNFFPQFSNKEKQILYIYMRTIKMEVCVCVNIGIYKCTPIYWYGSAHTHVRTCMYFSSSSLIHSFTTKTNMQMLVIGDLSMWSNSDLIIMSNKYEIIHRYWPLLLRVWYTFHSLCSLCVCVIELFFLLLWKWLGWRFWRHIRGWTTIYLQQF